MPNALLPVFEPADPINPEWTGQEATAFPDNWTIGMSFYTNLFAREHNAFVDEFRRVAAQTPEADSGLRNPARPAVVIRYKDVTPDELFEAARLVVAAEIAKIHTIEWTPQLLYDEPLYRGMNANWSGLLGGPLGDNKAVADALAQIVTQDFGKSTDVKKSGQWYSVFASGPGIFGLGSQVYADDPVFAVLDKNKKDIWDIRNPDHVNGGVNHFGSPFNFPEEFITVYRLHALVPDLIEYRDLQKDANQIQNKIPVIETFQGKATDAMRSRGLSNWALSMGRQRLGLLALQNHPRFLQNVKMGRLESATQTIDVAALDLIRDRERGVPRFNEFRRQYGLRQLTSFDDFVDARAPTQEQKDLVKLLREVYGQHTCDASKVITDAQLDANEKPINDCLGHRQRQHGGQRGGRGYRGRLAGRIDAPARLCDLRDAVRGVHSECIAPALQRPFLHLEFPPGVLFHAGPELGEEQRPRSGADGGRHAQRPSPAGVAAEARAAADDAGTGAGTAARGQCVRPLGARSRRVLFAGVEAAQRRGIRRSVQGQSRRSERIAGFRYHDCRNQAKEEDYATERFDARGRQARVPPHVGAGVLGLAAHSAALTADKAGSKPMRGVFPIGQTPFTEDDKLDLDCLAAEVKFCNRGGVHGFAWPQIASGWSTLSAQERFSGAEAILAAGKGGKTALAIGVQTQGVDLDGVIEIREACRGPRRRCHRLPAAGKGRRPGGHRVLQSDRRSHRTALDRADPGRDECGSYRRNVQTDSHHEVRERRGRRPVAAHHADP